MSSPSLARLLPLEEAHLAGGKARGLAQLCGLGLDVPPGFAVVDAHHPVPPEVLERWLARLGPGPVAVRSSADVEDGAERSWAGQFLTALDVRGPGAVLEAIAACVRSAGGATAQAYGGHEAARMHVVVQRMVAPRAAGVLFTADPVSGRRDRLVVEAVAGQGEALVSGRARAQRWVADLRGRVVSAEVQGEAPLLDEAQVALLVGHARQAARRLGQPLDLEWALDAGGRAWWLQARPITTLGPDVAFDTPAYDDHVYTRSNIGEMLPGVVTPLTWSVFGRGMEVSMAALAGLMGVDASVDEDRPYTCSFDGQLYFDLTRVYDLSAGMAGSTKHEVDLSIVGRAVPMGEAPPPQAGWRRGLNAARYLAMALDVEARVEAMAAEAAPPGVLPLPPGPATVAWFEKAHAWVDAGWVTHMYSSSVAGSLCAALVQVYSQRQPPRPEHYAAAAQALEGVEDAESAVLLDEVLALGDGLRALVPDLLRGGDDAALLAYLGEGGPASVREAWRALLQRHGHRSIREAELRVPEWAHQPSELLVLLRQARPPDVAAVRARHPDTEARPLGARLALKGLVPQARKAVARRERTKSLSVKRHVLLKGAYRALGVALAGLGRLAEPDLVYFLVHRELMELTLGPRPGLAALALARRDLFQARQGLRLPELCQGRPRVAERPAAAPGQFQGTPVARGVVRGPVRVARTFTEAQALQPGEVLVVPHIDVGWTPFFRVAAGVVTELGSPLSHAAVVAREVGIPTVVNVADATQLLATGQVVELDGAKGTVTPV